MALRFVGREDFDSAQLTRVNIGANDRASVVVFVGLNDCLIGSDLGLHLPCNGRERRLCTWPPFTLRAFVFEQMVRVDWMRAPRLTHRRQSGWRGVRGLKAFGLQVKAWLLDRFACTLLGVVDALLGALAGRLREHDKPTLGHAIVTQGNGLRTGPLVHVMPQRALERLADDL